MASLSVPINATPFEHTAYQLSIPPTPSHSRRKSREPSMHALPAFSFNPGAVTQDSNSAECENQNPEVETMSGRGHIRRASKPPPLPEFKFNPGADIPSDERLSPSHPVLEEMALNQQRVSRSARPAPLPQFTFGAASPTHTSPSPTKSEFTESTVGRPVGGHKRAGSEFVGGGGVEGPTIVSTSPVKHEPKPSGPPISGAGRRGHAHRRSQAVSISDIDTSDLIKTHAIAKARTGSQPSTPSETAPNFYSAMHASPSARNSISAISPPSSPRRRGSVPGNRPRVEFAERIDVIPRPLSMISSETEGSTSTARYGHSLNSSINSIASPIRLPSTLSSPVLEQGEPSPRPKTADPAMLLTVRDPSPERSLSVVNLPKRPLSAAGSPAMSTSENPPIKKKHFWFNHSPDRTPTPTPKAEVADPFADLQVFAPVPTTDKSRPKTSPERSASLVRRRKYHTWTHGFFSKRTKSRSGKFRAKRTPTPPALQRRTSDLVNEIFDADDTVVLRSHSPETKKIMSKINIPTSEPQQAKSLSEVASPVLDLDTAFGPFGSDERFGGEHNHRSAASRIAKLHSSERRGMTDAFGTVHRRTESAPSMPAFNRNSYSINRHGSNTSLPEDVFDEEEEDMFLAGEGKSQSKVQDKANKSLPKAEPIVAQPVETKSVGGLGLSNVSNATDAVLIVDPEECVTNNDLASSKSTIEAPMFTDSDFAKRPMSSPMSFAYPSTQSHYASSTEGRTTTSASMISSPDPDHIHFDNIPRFGPGFGEPSPDFYLRPSNDDLPSLSDSISSTALPRVSSSGTTRWSDEHRDQRSLSMFVPGTSRSNQSWKRSSLATLNRLIPGSANGSKLKFETMPDTASEHKSEKKNKRLSKLLTFWRSKEKMEG